MNYQQEWAGDSGEISEFDLVDSADADEDSEEERGSVPDEADAADADEQRLEVPVDEEEGPEAG